MFPNNLALSLKDLKLLVFAISLLNLIGSSWELYDKLPVVSVFRTVF